MAARFLELALRLAPALFFASCMGSSVDGTDVVAGAGGLPSSGASGASSSSGASGGSPEPSTGGRAQAGSAGTDSSAGAGGMPNTAGMAGGGDAGAPAVDIDPALVIPSAGCGKAPTQAVGEFVQYTIETSGTKDADSTDIIIDGPWTLNREYFVWLPPEYDENKAYPLVIQGPGCGGDGTMVYSLSPTNSAEGAGVNGTVIRVGLTPPDAGLVGHVEAFGGGCFDDKEGDDSVEWPFYEAVVDKLEAELCYDQNRVFASGNSSGAWLGNELGCKYAGNSEGYAIRGIAVNTGGLPTDPTRVPTCTHEPMAGFWINVPPPTPSAFSGNRAAIARAMAVNGCTMGTNYDDATLEDYPIGNGMPDDTCEKIVGCPALFPLVVCDLPDGPSSSHDDIANPGFATFIQSLAAP